MRMVNRGVVNIQMGVTTVRLVGSRNFIDLTYRRDVDAGQFAGPRVITATRAIQTSLSGRNPNLLRSTRLTICGQQSARTSSEARTS